MTRGNEAGGRVVCAGLLVADTFVPAVPQLPAAGDLVEVADFVLDAGGCAANTAITLAELGIDAAIVAAVGADSTGRWLIETLGDRGVETAGVLTSAEHGTSRTVILTVEGEDRRYLHAPGSNAALDAAAIERALPDAQFLVIGGYLALPGIDADDLAQVLQTARSAGTRTLLDVVIPRGQSEPAAPLRQVLPHVDVFMPNRDEAAALVWVNDPVEQASALLEWGCGAVVVTCGADGAVYADADRVLRVRPYDIELVDGSGAGDAFTAGLVTGMLEGWPIEETLRFASAVGASACRGLGCTTTLFTREEALAAAPDVHLVELAHPAR